MIKRLNSNNDDNNNKIDYNNWTKNLWRKLTIDAQSAKLF